MSLAVIVGIIAAIAGVIAAAATLLDYLNNRKTSAHSRKHNTRILKVKFKETRDRKLRNFLEAAGSRGSSSEKTIFEIIRDLQEIFPDEITGNSDALKILDLLTKQYKRAHKKQIYGKRRERLRKGIEDLRAKIESGDPDRSFESSNSPEETDSPRSYQNMVIVGFLGITLLTTFIWPLSLRLLLQPEPGIWFPITLQQRVSEEPVEAFEVFSAMWLLLASILICSLLFEPIRRKLLSWGAQPNTKKSPGGDPNEGSSPAPGGADPEK